MDSSVIRRLAGCSSRTATQRTEEAEAQYMPHELDSIRGTFTIAKEIVKTARTPRMKKLASALASDLVGVATNAKRAGAVADLLDQLDAENAWLEATVQVNKQRADILQMASAAFNRMAHLEGGR